MVNYVYLVATVSTFMWVSTFTLPTNEAIEDGSVRLGNCRSNNDCRPSGCCVIGTFTLFYFISLFLSIHPAFSLIGLMRFSSPWCQPLLQLGDTCRPASSKPILNTTLSYPNGLHVTLKDAHQVIFLFSLL